MTSESPTSRVLLGVALISGALLMIELSLTRIFSVTMYTTSRSWRSRSRCSG